MCNAVGDGDDALGVLLGAVRRFLDGPAPACTPYELGESLIRLRHGIDLLELGFAARAALFATTDEYDIQGSTSAIDWVRHRCRMSGNAAARSVAAGGQVDRLPETVAALEAGDIGFSHLSLLAATARALTRPGLSGTDPAAMSGEGDATGAEPAPGDATDPGIPTPCFDERPLLALALEHSVGRFQYDCEHARHAGDAAAELRDDFVGELVSEFANLRISGCAAIDLGDNRLRGGIAHVEKPGLDGDFGRGFGEITEGD